MNHALRQIVFLQRVGNINAFLQAIVKFYPHLAPIKPEILNHIKYHITTFPHIISPATIEAIKSLSPADLQFMHLDSLLDSVLDAKPEPAVGSIPFPAVSSQGVVREMSVSEGSNSSLCPLRLRLLDDTGAALFKVISQQLSRHCIWRPEQFIFHTLDLYGNDDLTVEGTSMSLPLALALCSKIINRPIPPDLSATAVVARDGSMAPVDSIESKLRILRAERPFIKRVVVCDRQKLRDVPPGMEIIKVKSLSDAIARVFPGHMDVSQIGVALNVEAEIASVNKQYDIYLIDTCEENARELIEYLEKPDLQLPSNRLIPALFVSYWRKGCCHCHKGEAAEAEENLKRAMGLYRKHPGLISADEYFELRNQYGVLLKDLFLYKEAERVHLELAREMETSLCLDHTKGANWSSLSQLYLAQRRFKEAEHYQRKALRLINQDERYRNYGYLAQIHARAGDFRKAGRALSMMRQCFEDVTGDERKTKRPFLDWVQVEYLYLRGSKSARSRRQILRRLYHIAAQYQEPHTWVEALINKFLGLALLLEKRRQEGLEALDKAIAFFDAQFAAVLKVLGASVKAHRALYFLKQAEVSLALGDMEGILEDLSAQKDIKRFFRKELNSLSRIIGKGGRANKKNEAAIDTLQAIIVKIPY